MIITELRTRLQEAGFDARYADATEALAQCCVRFCTFPTDEEHLPLGCSKLGGHPDLPMGVLWPLHRGRPLDFLCQIALDDLRPYPVCRMLPPEGHLYFFLDAVEQPEGYDPTDRGNGSVIFLHGPATALTRRRRPDQGLPKADFRPCRIAFHEALSPGWEAIPIHALPLDGADEDRYQHFIDGLSDEKAHQLLGKPGRIENIEQTVQLECQFLSNGILLDEDGRPFDKARATELAPDATDWKLLLQLDSDPGAGMDWGDSMVSFWIREQDLRERNFSKIWQVDERF